MSDVEELVRIFRQEASERIDELVGILHAQHEVESLRLAKAAAHNLKGAALTVGAQIVAGPCEVFEEEFQASLNAGKVPDKIQLETWVQILVELKDIIGNPTLLPLNFGNLAELNDDIQNEIEYVRVSNPSGSPSELIASNRPRSMVQIGATRTDLIRNCLERIEAVRAVMCERTAKLQSLEEAQAVCVKMAADSETDSFHCTLELLNESCRNLDVLLDELRTLLEAACNTV